jgi:hypothetical protein
MDVDVPNLHCLLVAALMSIKGLDHIELDPEQLSGVAPAFKGRGVVP